MTEENSMVQELLDILAEAGVAVTTEDHEELEGAIDTLLNGFSDSGTYIASGKYVRLINEDEYDQHMPDEDKPESDSIGMLGTAGAYVWVE